MILFTLINFLNILFFRSSSISDYTIYNGSNGNHRNIDTRNNSNDFTCESNSVFHSNGSPGECFSPASSSNRKFGFSSNQQKGLSKGGRNRVIYFYLHFSKKLLFWLF